MKFAVIAALLLTACSSSAPPAPLVPEWDVIPAGVVSALCTRMENDAMTSGTLTLIKTTRPLVTTPVLGALARGASRMRPVPPPSNAELPVQVPTGTTCTFTPANAIDPNLHYDQMVVELSAPFANPFGKEAGIVARVSLGGQQPAYYYIPLASRGGGWSIGFVSVLAQ